MVSVYSQAKKITPDIINGFVLDCNTRQPVFLANLQIQDSDESSITNDTGEFKIITWKNLPVTVKIEHENFQPVDLKITCTKDRLIVMLRRK